MHNVCVEFLSVFTKSSYSFFPPGALNKLKMLFSKCSHGRIEIRPYIFAQTGIGRMRSSVTADDFVRWCVHEAENLLHLKHPALMTSAKITKAGRGIARFDTMDRRQQEDAVVAKVAQLLGLQDESS